MPYRDLREFISRLEAGGELVRVGAPVRPPAGGDLEISEIVDRVSKGPASQSRAPL